VQQSVTPIESRIGAQFGGSGPPPYVSNCSWRSTHAALSPARMLSLALTMATMPSTILRAACMHAARVRMLCSLRHEWRLRTHVCTDGRHAVGAVLMVG
jgi:hypothetical protein